MVLRVSVTGGCRPKLKKIQPLIRIGRQRLFQGLDGLAQRALQSGVAIIRWNRRDRITHESMVPQSTLANHEAGQHRGPRDLRKQEGTKREGSGLRKKGNLGIMTLVDAVPLHRDNLVSTQGL